MGKTDHPSQSSSTEGHSSDTRTIENLFLLALVRMKRSSASTPRIVYAPPAGGEVRVDCLTPPFIRVLGVEMEPMDLDRLQ